MAALALIRVSVPLRLQNTSSLSLYSAGVVTTLAGGASGWVDGPGATALFTTPSVRFRDL